MCHSLGSSRCVLGFSCFSACLLSWLVGPVYTPSVNQSVGTSQHLVSGFHPELNLHLLNYHTNKLCLEQCPYTTRRWIPYGPAVLMFYSRAATGKESTRAAGHALHSAMLIAFPTLPPTQANYQTEQQELPCGPHIDKHICLCQIYTHVIYLDLRLRS